MSFDALLLTPTLDCLLRDVNRRNERWMSGRRYLPNFFADSRGVTEHSRKLRVYLLGN